MSLTGTVIKRVPFKNHRGAGLPSYGAKGAQNWLILRDKAKEGGEPGPPFEMPLEI
jgi:hypothetical protein